MCRHQENVLTWGSTPASGAGSMSMAIQAVPAGGSRRRKLWDLPQMCHCPVIGVCLPLDVLRRIVQKFPTSKALTDDYDIHVVAVGHCDRRTPLSEQLHAELERRYQLVVRQYRVHRDEASLEKAWQAAVRNGEAAASLWAVLTHPNAGMVLIERVIHAMHMLQHQAGAAERVDRAEFRSLQEDSRRQSDQLRQAEERHVRQLAERDRRLELAELEIARLRAESVGKDSLIQSLKSTVAELHIVMPDAAGIKRLRAEVEDLRSYAQGLERRLRRDEAGARPVVEIQPVAMEEVVAAGAVECPGMAERRLDKRTVLCVGGRTRGITEVRDLIEEAGGQFAYHDGGFENSLHQLDSTLAAADLVICQTGCISHNAYWRVKTHCKRTGKRCVFVEAPGKQGLLKHLNELADEALASQNDCD